MSTPDAPLLQAVWRELADELEAQLRQAGEEELADSVSALRVHRCCGCDVEDCQSFFTAPPPRGGRDSVVLENGVALDLIDRQIAFVEWLRPGPSPEYDALCRRVGREERGMFSIGFRSRRIRD